MGVESDVARLAACIWVSRMYSTSGMGVLPARRMLRAYESPERLYADRPATVIDRMQAPPASNPKILRYLSDVGRRRSASQAAIIASGNGVGCVMEGEVLYPSRLMEIRSRPLFLFYMGDLDRVLNRASSVVTMVGSRKPTNYGRAATKEIAGCLAKAGVTVVSGLARGIDSIAHQAVLDAGGLTAAVLAGGIDHVYPPEHAGLVREISEKGVVVSEHGPGIRPVRSFFAARNRILSGLADCVAVSEASVTSGSMITAGFAADQGRDLFALPGSIYQEQSQGCHQLIREGADILTGAEDLLYRLPMGRMPRMTERAVQDMTANADPLGWRNRAGSESDTECFL